MKIIDLKPDRGTYTTILEYKDGQVLFEGKNEKNGKDHHYINRYNIEKDYFKEIYRGSVSNCETDFQYTYIIKEEIIIIKIYDKYKIGVDTIDKITGEIKFSICRAAKYDSYYI